MQDDRRFSRKDAKVKEEEPEESNEELSARRQALLTMVKETFPSSMWQYMSPEIYTTFWSLSLSDIYVPRERYEEEIQKQKHALEEAEHKSDPSVVPAHVTPNLNSKPASKIRKEKERITALISELQAERERQEKKYNLVIERLTKEKDTWFTKSLL